MQVVLLLKRVQHFRCRRIIVEPFKDMMPLAQIQNARPTAIGRRGLHCRPSRFCLRHRGLFYSREPIVVNRVSVITENLYPSTLDKPTHAVKMFAISTAGPSSVPV